MAAIRKVAHLVEPSRIVTISLDKSDNRFLECAESGEADCLVPGNTKHFPQSYQKTNIVTSRRFLDIFAKSGNQR